MTPETLQTIRDIIHEIGLGGVIAIWALWRMEKKIDRGFFKTNRRIRRLGVASATIARTLNGNEENEDLADDEDDGGAEDK